MGYLMHIEASGGSPGRRRVHPQVHTIWLKLGDIAEAEAGTCHSAAVSTGTVGHVIPNTALGTVDHTTAAASNT